MSSQTMGAGLGLHFVASRRHALCGLVPWDILRNGMTLRLGLDYHASSRSRSDEGWSDLSKGQRYERLQKEVGRLLSSRGGGGGGGGDARSLLGTPSPLPPPSPSRRGAAAAAGSDCGSWL